MSRPQRFRKKPVEVYAWQWVSDRPEAEAEAIVAWIEENNTHPQCGAAYDPTTAGASGPNGEDWGCLEIDTLEGTMEVAPYDYVIRGVKGEFYPCKPDILAASYEAIK
jgi:hypothetical protein